MTADQADSLMAYLIACFPNAPAPVATQAIYLQHLEPLPYERTEKALRQLVLTHQYPSLPTIAEVVRAAGVDDDERRGQLLRAIAAKKPLVRDAASATGWAVGQAILPPEALPPPVKSLPAGPVIDDEEKAALLARLRGYAGALSAGGEADR